MKKQKIKILFDAVPIAKAQVTGVGKTTAGLVTALARAYPDELELVGHYFSFLGKNRGFTLPTAPNIRYRQTRLIPGRVYNMLRRLGVPIPYEMLVKERGDFHLFTSFIGWPSLFRTPSTTFFHDITYITNPEYVSGPNCYDLRSLMPGTVKRANFIITNSESSKQGITSTYNLRGKEILIAPIPPVDIVTLTQSEAQIRIERLGVNGDFILYFGTLEPRKNLVGLLNAYEKLPIALKQKYSLVVAGGKGWKDDEILATIARLTKKGAKIIQTGYVSDEDRAALYMRTTLYVNPSHYEGFGMQLLEAMTYHTPMLVSDIPVLREVAGDAAAYCATNPTSIKTAIVGLLVDVKRQKSMVLAGKRRIKDFSWDKVAEDIYRQIQKAVEK